MAQLAESRPRGAEMLAAPARPARFALPIALVIAVSLALALAIERPMAPEVVEDARVTPTSEQIYDGRGKWTGY